MAPREVSKLTEAGLKVQVKRLAGYHGYNDMKHEILRVLMTHAASDEHAERVITHILDTRRPNENSFISCPTPAEMIDYLAMFPATLNQRKAPDPGCPICGGSGWRFTERDGISGADKCPCTLA